MRNALVCLLLCAPVLAVSAGPDDDIPVHEGAWNMRLEPNRAARLLVKDWAGTWQETGPRSRAMSAACHGKRFPITVQHSNASEFEFTAWGSTVSPACPDIAFSLKPVDARTMDGTTGSGEKVAMRRASGR